MSGFIATHPHRSDSLCFLLRLALATLAGLGLAQIFGGAIVARMLPAVAAEMLALDDNMAILSLDVVGRGGGDTVRLRANLLRPIRVENTDIYPFGAASRPRGGYQIDVNARRMLQGSLILLIALLSWPGRNWREFAMRAAMAPPLGAILFALDAPLELLGNFQQAVIRGVGHEPTRLLFAWDRLLDGGGSTVLALTFAVIAINLADRVTGAKYSRPILA